MRGPFDLDQPVQNLLAYVKTTLDLDGALAYVPMASQVHLLDADDEPVHLGRSAGLYLYATRRLDDEPDGTPRFEVRSRYTGVWVDDAGRPVDRLRVPALGLDVRPEPTLLDGTTPLKPRAPTPDAPGGYAWAAVGDELVFFLEGLGASDGRARAASLIWRAARSAVMDPDARQVPARYSNASLHPASDRKWLGLSPESGIRMHWQTIGRKVYAPAEVPSTVRDAVAALDPARLQL